MKYIFLVMFLLAGAAYFGYTEIDEHYSNRVSGNVVMLEKEPSGEAIIVGLEPDTLKYGYSNLWDSWLTLTIATVVGFFVSGGFFFYCAPTLADVELKRKIKRLEEENKRASSLYKSDLKEKIEQANRAEETAKSALNDEFAEVERLQDRAQQELIKAENEKRSAEKLKRETIALVNEAKAKQSEAEDLKSKEEFSKVHASQAMQRYKRKVDKLKADQDELFKFIKQHHPNLIKDDN